MVEVTEDATTERDDLISGRYRLVMPIGQGATAVVWRAVDLTLQRDVAVKVVADASHLRRRLLARFERESRLAASLNHPNVVTVHDAGIDRGRCFLVMELVDGSSLREILAGRVLDCGQASRLAIDVLSALHAAHGLGILHRDVKPANILVTPDGQVKVTDFGVATLIGIPSDLTEDGAFVGTAHYAAPEQLAGRPVSPSSDLYSLGVVFTEMVTGLHRRPTTADVDDLNAVAPPELVAIIRCLLNEDVQRRPMVAAEVGRALTHFANPTYET